MKKHNTSKVVLLVVTALWLLSAFVLPDKNWAHLVKTGLTLVEFVLLILNCKESNNTFKAILVTIMMFMLLSWILPAAYYSDGFIDQGRTQMGLFDLFNYPVTALSYFGYIAIFVLAVGGFYGILYKIPAYRSFLDKIVAVFKGKEMILLSLVMVLIAVLTSICGLQIGLLVFFPMLASIILLMGYDKIVAALTLVGSTVVGLIGTTYAYSNVSILNESLGLAITDNILVKFVILVAGLVLLIFNVIMYARNTKVASAPLAASKTVIKTEEEVKVEVKEEKEEMVEKVEKTEKPKTSTTKGAGKNAKKGNGKKQSGKGKSSSKASKNDVKAAAKGDEVIVVKESLVDETLEKYVPTVVNSKYKVYPFIIAVVLMFVIMTLAFIPWASVFELKAFEEATKAVTDAQLFGFNIFGKLLGTFYPFGQWGLVELILVMLSFSGILAFIYKLDFNDVVDGFINGIKKALVPAFLVVGIYTCLIVTYTHLYQTTIYESLLGLTKGFNIVTTSITGFLSGLFNGDPAYAFQILVPHFAGVVTNTDIYPIAGILFQAMYGVSMLVAPTSVVLMVVLNYLDVSFKQWFSAVWKLLLELVVVLLLVFTILLII